MNIPYELLWGVDVAIKKLRPNAIFTLSNSTFIQWNDTDGLLPPTWDEIYQQINLDREVAKKWMNETSIADNLPPTDGKNYIWNKILNVWEQEPDYNVE